MYVHPVLKIFSHI